MPFLPRGVALVVALSSAACGKSATAPTSGADVPRTGTHTISAGDLAVTFWFVFDPPANSVVLPLSRFSIEVHCRASRPADYRLSTYFDLLRPDGTVIGALGVGGGLGTANIGYDVNGCAGNHALANGSFPSAGAFDTAPSFNIRVFLRPIPPTSTVNYDLAVPDLLVSERVNWRR